MQKKKLYDESFVFSDIKKSGHCQNGGGETHSELLIGRKFV